jgi:regulator of nucleoside diphosphate kinase
MWGRVSPPPAKSSLQKHGLYKPLSALKRAEGPTMYASRAPLITLSSADYTELIFAAELVRWRIPPLARFLRSQLRHAKICHPHSLPSDVVAPGRIVSFLRTGASNRKARILVYPEEAISSHNHLSVITPLGVALLGLRPGDAVVCSCDDGVELRVAVLDVVDSQKSLHRSEKADIPSHSRVAVSGWSSWS